MCERLLSASDPEPWTDAPAPPRVLRAEPKRRACCSNHAAIGLGGGNASGGEEPTASAAADDAPPAATSAPGQPWRVAVLSAPSDGRLGGGDDDSAPAASCCCGIGAASADACQPDEPADVALARPLGTVVAADDCGVTDVKPFRGALHGADLSGLDALVMASRHDTAPATVGAGLGRRTRDESNDESGINEPSAWRKRRQQEDDLERLYATLQAEVSGLSTQTAQLLQENRRLQAVTRTLSILAQRVQASATLGALGRPAEAATVPAGGPGLTALPQAPILPRP